MKEKLAGEHFPSLKSKHRVTAIVLEHTKPINQKKITDFLTKLAGGTVTVATWRNAKVDELDKNSSGRVYLQNLKGEVERKKIPPFNVSFETDDSNTVTEITYSGIKIENRPGYNQAISEVIELLDKKLK